MKNLLFVFLILSSITCAFAITVGVEPPSSYINNLKNCNPGTYKSNVNGLILEYKIKGKLQNGRCEVQSSEYYDFNNPQTVKDMKSMLGMFSEMGNHKATDSELNSAINQIKNSQSTVTTCRFSQAERNALVDAYNKHDSKQTPSETKRDSNGNIVSLKASFSSDKMSSYDNLLINYSNALCISSDDTSSKNSKTYTCQYNGATCYYKDYGSGAISMTCSKDTPSGSIDKVKALVNSGSCSRVF